MLAAVFLGESEGRLLVSVEGLKVVSLPAMFNKNLSCFEISVLTGDVKGCILCGMLFLISVGTMLKEDLHDTVELLLSCFQ
jgi:hypothetical protein